MLDLSPTEVECFLLFLSRVFCFLYWQFYTLLQELDVHQDFYQEYCCRLHMKAVILPVKTFDAFLSFGSRACSVVSFNIFRASSIRIQMRVIVSIKIQNFCN